MREYIDPVISIQHLDRVREEHMRAQRFVRMAREATSETTEQPAEGRASRRWVGRALRIRAVG